MLVIVIRIIRIGTALHCVRSKSYQVTWSVKACLEQEWVSVILQGGVSTLVAVRTKDPRSSVAPHPQGQQCQNNISHLSFVKHTIYTLSGKNSLMNKNIFTSCRLDFVKSRVGLRIYGAGRRSQRPAPSMTQMSSLKAKLLLLLTVTVQSNGDPNDQHWVDINL